MSQILPAFRLIPEPMDDEARAVTAEPRPDWVWEKIGTRHQLGGIPEFVQSDEYPSCKSCGEAMTFYAQLDAINHKYDLADSGLLYVFICFDCFETVSFIQSF